jgi:peptidoglycan hydrolase-like protein with peptidoglycan-binding domain
VYAPGQEAPQIFANLPDGNLSKYVLSFLKKAIPEQALVSDMNRYFEILETLGYNPNDEDHRIAFQMRYQIIKDEKDPAAGNIGPNTRKKLENLSKEITKAIPKEGLELGHEGEEVRKLQALLHEAGYLSVKPTGAFKEMTQEALVKFQMDQKLINTVAHQAAGYLGPGTKKALQKIAAKTFGISKQDQVTIHELKMDEIQALAVAASEALNQVPEQPIAEPKDPMKDALTALTREWIQDHAADELSEMTVNKIELAKVNQKIQPLVSPFTMRLGPGIKHPEVKKLQVFLKEKGFFSGELITEVFGKETKKAVIAFQIQHQVIASKTQADAGIIGSKTLAVLNALYYQDEYSLPIAVASKIRAPAVHPRDLKIQLLASSL